jgi:hypothetical protein
MHSDQERLLESELQPAVVRYNYEVRGSNVTREVIARVNDERTVRKEAKNNH